MLFAKDAMPGVPLIGYCEYFYNATGSDLDFDPAFTVPEAGGGGSACATPRSW